MMENAADVFLGLHDFLERMRKPSAADFVKSIKSFIVSFSNNPPDPEKDCAAAQEFFAKMEAAFRAHPLWSGCTEEELESAGEGLEKYVMTKLFTRVFASLPEDAKYDEQLSKKMALIQQFISPENLDIKPTYQNETSWLLAQKELQKINMYKAPRDKLLCILNCCKVINNLLLNASIASNENTPGADEFLPVLIYVTIKANPPQLHSNLLYIQRYRRQSKLVGEAAYFFTNMLSAESFISNIDAKALSMDEAEFEKNMEFAHALLSGLVDSQSNQPDESSEHCPGNEPVAPKTQMLKNSEREKDLMRSRSSDNLSKNKEVPNPNSQIMIKKTQYRSDLENKGAALLLKDNQASNIFQEYPYIFSSAGDLTIGDVEDLLNNYKRLVFKYVCLSQGLSDSTACFVPSSSPLQVQSSSDAAKESENHKILHSDVNLKMDSDGGGHDLRRVLQFEGENVVHKLADETRGDYGAKAETKDEDVDSKVPGPENAGFEYKAPPAENEDVDSKKQPAESESASPNSQLVEDKSIQLKDKDGGSEIPHVGDQDDP